MALKFHSAPDAVGNKTPEEGHDTIAGVDHADMTLAKDAADDVARYGFWFHQHGVFECAVE